MEWTAPALSREAGADQTPQANAQQERDQYRRDAVHGRADDEREDSTPSDLVGHAAKARHREREQHERHVPGSSVCRVRECPGRAALLLRRGGRPAAARSQVSQPDPTSQDAQRYVRGRGEGHCAAHAEAGQKHEPGRKRAERRAEGVERIQQPNAAARLLATLSVILRQHGQRAAHEATRQKQHREGHREPKEAERVERQLELRVGLAVNGQSLVEDIRDKDRVDPDRHLEYRVKKQRPPKAIHRLAKEVTPQGQSRHERGGHRADREDGGSDGQDHHADPHHFVD